jgi:hypothetical protein
MEATTTTSPPVTTSSSTSGALTKPSVPLRTTTADYKDALQAAAAADTPSTAVEPDVPAAQIPDNRRNSQGEVLKSPTEKWRPDFERTQSWSTQDMKRQVQLGEVGKEKREGEVAGFTEASERKDAAEGKAPGTKV